MALPPPTPPGENGIHPDPVIPAKAGINRH